MFRLGAVPMSSAVGFVCCLLGALSLVSLSHAEDIQISASPVIIQAANGKLPSSVLLAVTAKECKGVDLRGYTLQIAAPGLSLSQTSGGECTISATLSIDPNTPAGKYKIILTKSGVPSGSADFAVLETTAGAIPGGIAPQVDVLWQVLTQKVCNDVFGKRVARNFYCIEVKVGNNTGHPLQLAGIGFSQELQLPGVSNTDVILANTSYASTRAVLLRESIVSPRNVFFHSVQGTGLIMAGFIPFLHAANAAAHYATAAAIVSGPLLQAINLVGPDRVITQLNNLDDESFRDNQIIPNNTQIRTIVFVEKLAVSELLNGLSRGVANKIVQLQKEAAKADELQMSDSMKSESQSAAKTAQKDVARIVEVTRKNSSQLDTSVFKPFQSKDFSPLLVKLALGNLVVVGNEIEYLQRVQVQGASSPNTSALTLSPSHLLFGDQDLAKPSKPQTVTVTNSTTAAVSGVTINVSGSNREDFTSASQCDPGVDAGASCTITVTFTPTAQGARGATLDVAYAGGSSQSVSLSGNGVVPAPPDPAPK